MSDNEPVGYVYKSLMAASQAQDSLYNCKKRSSCPSGTLLMLLLELRCDNDDIIAKMVDALEAEPKLPLLSTTVSVAGRLDLAKSASS